MHFQHLYNKPEDDTEDNPVYADLSQNKTQLEHDIIDSDNVSNAYINEDMLYNEMVRAVARLKKNKSVAVDVIPNDILKFEDVKQAMLVCFNKCFTLGKVPSVWLKAVIILVPKRSSNDPCVPLNYQGISI